MANFQHNKISELCESSTRHYSSNTYPLNSSVDSITLENAAGDSKLPENEKRKSTDSEVKLLKTKISDLQNRFNKLVFENEKTNIDLAHEKHKVIQLERQLQFVKDNQVIFEKLREAYIRMKYNEAAGRKLVEIRDKSVQTWDGVLCRACLDTEKLRGELEQMQITYHDCIMIKRDEMDEIRKTMETLKSYVQSDAFDSSNFLNSGECNPETRSVQKECNNTFLKIKKRILENEGKRRTCNYGKNAFRTQSVDRASYIKLSFPVARKFKCKISKSSVDVFELNCGKQMC